MASPFNFVTPRLRLYAPTLAELKQLGCGERAGLGARIGAVIRPEWPGPHLAAALPEITQAMAHEPGDARWVWIVVEPSTARVIGDVGFHGPLSAGATAEIGYVLLPDARGHGYAAEATAAVIQWTFANTQVAQIIAQIEPSNAASLRVAAKLGMQELRSLSAGNRCFGVSRPRGG